MRLNAVQFEWNIKTIRFLTNLKWRAKTKKNGKMWDDKLILNLGGV